SHEVDLLVEALDADRLQQADLLRLQIVRAQYQFDHRVGHAGKQRVAIIAREFADRLDRAERDLDVDFEVGGIDAAGIVDGIGIEAAAIECELDASGLGQAEIAALAHHLAAQVAAVDANAVVGAVADLRMRLAAGLDVGADAAVPEQVDRRAQQLVDQLVRRHAPGADAERL